MGALTDLIVAEATDAPAIASAFSDDRRWRRWDCKGLDHVKLGKLDAVLRQSEYDRAFVGTCKDLATGGDDGPWVCRVPAETVALIAAIADAELPRIAAAWSATEEFKRFKDPSSVAEQYLASLREASRSSVQSNLPLLMWLSL